MELIKTASFFKKEEMPPTGTLSRAPYHSQVKELCQCSLNDVVHYCRNCNKLKENTAVIILTSHFVKLVKVCSIDKKKLFRAWETGSQCNN